MPVVAVGLLQAVGYRPTTPPGPPSSTLFVSLDLGPISIRNTSATFFYPQLSWRHVKNVAQNERGGGGS